MRWLMVALLMLACTKKQETNAPAAAVPAASEADRISAFWRWVTEHARELKQTKTGQEAWATSLAGELATIDKSLAFELGLNKAGPLQVIISADGNQKLFPLVQRVVKAAPADAGFEPVAFRQRKGEGFRLTMEGVSLSPTTIWFTAQADASRPGMVSVVVYIKGLPADGRERFLAPTMVMLDAALGEYDVETKVGEIDIKPAPAIPDSAHQPFAQLPAVVDRLAAK